MRKDKTVVIALLFFGPLIGQSILTETEQEIPYESLPMAVQAAAEKILGAGEREAEIKLMDGVRVFEVESEQDDREIGAVLTETGLVVVTSREIAFDELPEPIQVIIQRDHPDKNFEEVEKVERHFYRLEFEENGDERLLTVYPTGKVISSDEDD